MYGVVWIIAFKNLAFTTVVFVTFASTLREPNSYVNFLYRMKVRNYRWIMLLSCDKWQPLGGPLSKQYWHNLYSVYVLYFKLMASDGMEMY